MTKTIIFEGIEYDVIGASDYIEGINLILKPHTVDELYEALIGMNISTHSITEIKDGYSVRNNWNIYPEQIPQGYTVRGSDNGNVLIRKGHR